MDNPIVKSVFGAVAGLVVAVFVVGAVQAAGHMLFPLPEGIDPTDPADQAQMMAVTPFGSKASVVLAWFCGALAGSAAALFISNKLTPGWIVAGFMVLASVATTQMFPHPVWMVVAAIFVPIMGKLLADQLLKSRLSS